MKKPVEVIIEELKKTVITKLGAKRKVLCRKAPFDFIAWKKAHVSKNKRKTSHLDLHVVLIKMIIKKGTEIRLHHGDYIDHRKCRTASAKIISFYDLMGKKISTKNEVVYSSYDSNFEYELKKELKPKFSFDNSAKTCASGIHFFLNKKDAENYGI